MPSENVRDALTTLMIEQFRNPALIVEDSTTAADVPGWDSLSHIDFLFAVEQRFGIALSTREVRNMKNVGALIDLITQKIA